MEQKYHQVKFFDSDNCVGGNNSVIIDDMLDLVKGVIDEGEYQKMLDEIWFFAKTPRKFSGYNVPSSSFPFWSSPSLTYATSLLALSKYETLERCEQDPINFNKK